MIRDPHDPRDFPPGSLLLVYYCRDEETREDIDKARNRMALLARAWITKKLAHMGVRASPDKLLQILEGRIRYTIHARSKRSYLSLRVELEKIAADLDPQPGVVEIPQYVWDNARAGGFGDP